MRRLPTTARELRLNMYTVRSSHSDVDVPIRTHTRGVVARSKLLHLILRDFSCGRLARAIYDHLQDTGDKPILIDRVVGIDRDDVEANIVRVTICEDWYKWSEVEEIGRQVQRAI